MSFALLQPIDFLPDATPAYPITETHSPEECPCYFSLPYTSALLPILSKQRRFFLETGAQAQLEAALEQLWAANPDFGVSLTTKSAYDSTLAETLVIAIEQRFFVNRTQRMHMMTCLQEAIANAVLHGNLDMDSLTDSPKIQDYYDKVASRIRQYPYANRRVCIAASRNGTNLLLSVSDHGKGIPPGIIPECEQTPARVCGRGLFLIRSLADDVWIGKDGRTLCMNFRGIA